MSEIDNLRAEIEKLRDERSRAFAVTMAPDDTNDGGPADLAEEMKMILHNQNVYLEEAVNLRAEVERLREIEAAAREYKAIANLADNELASDADVRKAGWKIIAALGEANNDGGEAE